MAYTKNPKLDTYDTKRFPFVGSHNARSFSGAKDQRYVNCYPESIKNPLNQGKRIYLIKRPGLVTTVNPGYVDTGRGVFFWKGSVYSAFGNRIYKDTTQISSITLTGTSGTVGFVAVNGATEYLFVCDGTSGWVINSSGTAQLVGPYPAWTASTARALDYRARPVTANGYYYKVTTAGTTGASEPAWPTTIGNTVVDGTVTWTCVGVSGGFPSTHIPTPVFADGYIVLAGTNDDTFWNSDLDDPFTWSPSNGLSAEMYPDNIAGIFRQNNQIGVLGENSTEFFYNAANVNQSPFARNDAAAQQLGCAAFNTITAFEQNVLFVGQSELGGRCVWKIEAFKPERVSIEWIDDLLDQEASNISNANAFIVRVRGHQFYVLNLSTRTVVYDLDEKMWHEWSSNNAGSHETFKCNYACDYYGEALVQHSTNGKIYKLDPYTYQDDGTAIIVEGVTSLIDLENNDRKTCHTFTLLADRTPVPSYVTVSYSDNDYQSWSAGRAVDLSTRPFLLNQGMFRRRAYKVVYTDNYPFRAEAIELYINQHKS